MMRMLVAGAALALGILSAFAQADRTGTGGGPLSTDTAPNTTSVGQTKPPSGDPSPADRGDIDRRTSNDRKEDAIADGICIGCGPK